MAFDDSFFGRHAIEPRFMSTGKSVYYTFEFRFINMIVNYNEFKTIVNTLVRWIWYIIRSRPTFKISIVPKDFIDFNNLIAAKQLCKDWINNIGLDWEDGEYETLWNRNYKNRIKLGKLL